MKYLSLVLFSALAIATSACTHAVTLKGRMSPEMVGVIKPEYNTDVVLDVKTQVPEILELPYSGHTYEIAFNAAAKGKLNDYLREKFPKDAGKGTKPLALKVEILSAVLDYNIEQSDGDAALAFFAGVNQGTSKAQAVVKMKVSASGLKTINEAVIVGQGDVSDEFSATQYSHKGMLPQEAMASAINEALDRALISLDRQLSRESVAGDLRPAKKTEEAKL